MNLVSLKISIDDSIKILKSLNLYKGSGTKSIGDHSEEFKKTSRENKHTTIYNCAIRNRDYEVLLRDDSIFQFSLNGDVLRYAFIQNPNTFADKKDYLIALYGNEELLQFAPDELESLEKSIVDEDYEQFLNEQELNLDSHIIRYDLDSNGYEPLIHSYSHIHIGTNPHFRLPCAKTLTPLKFVLFSIKHTYYNEWKQGFGTIPDFEDQIRISKAACKTLPKQYWVTKETYELHLV